MVSAVFICDKDWTIRAFMQESSVLSLHTGEQLTALVQEKEELMQDAAEPRSMTLTFPALSLALSALVRSFPEGTLVVLMQCGSVSEALHLTELYAKGVEWAEERFRGLYHSEYYLIQQLNNQLVDSKRALARSNSRLRQALTEVEQTNTQLEQARQTAVEAMQLAEKANRSKTTFLANMSHDIRTPMNAIVGLTELMRREAGTSDKMQHYLDKLQITSQYLLDMLSDVLNISKIESGSVALRDESVNLASQIAQVAAVIRPQAQEHKHRLSITASHIRHEDFRGDATRLRQIFVNLLSNAVKYTPDGGNIAFSVCETPGSDELHTVYRFTVTDDGMGMSEEFLQHIFEPFARSEEAQSRQIQGTGLGMAITHSFAEMMGGTLEVESEPNKGSTFTFTLPVTLDAQAARPISAKDILLVGMPDEVEREILFSVEETPIRAKAVADTSEAAALLRGGDVKAALVFCGGITDVLHESVKTLRAASPDTLLFGCAPQDLANEVRDAGMDGFLPLPFFVSALESEIEHAMQRRGGETEKSASILHGLRLLCAEDNELNAEILRTLLELAGAECTICENGRELVDTFERAQSRSYDVILTDVRMPVMDGTEAAQCIRRSTHPDAKTIPIIAMTANVFAEDIQHCLDCGMNAHVGKPIDIGILETEIGRQLSR